MPAARRARTSARQRVGIQGDGQRHGPTQPLNATARTAQQGADGGFIAVGLGKHRGQAVHLPEGAEVSIADLAAAHEAAQHRGHTAPAVAVLMGVDGGGGGGDMAGRAVNGAGGPVVVAGPDVTGDVAEVELTAVQVVGCVPGCRLLWGLVGRCTKIVLPPALLLGTNGRLRQIRTFASSVRAVEDWWVSVFPREGRR